MQVNYINQPYHPVSIMLIGAGGNGSQMLTQLGRMDYALKKLGKPGLTVILVDDDIVSASNVGRQLFSQHEVGEYKANVLISRINRFYGLNWYAINDKFDGKNYDPQNIMITATDNVNSRLMMQKFVKTYSAKKYINHYRHNEVFHYWLDMGNLKDRGQVVVGSPRYNLPTIVDMYPNMKKMEAQDDTPSCSLAEALEKQDLFINPFISMTGAKLLWEMLTQEQVNWQGAYMNLSTLNFKKISA